MKPTHVASCGALRLCTMWCSWLGVHNDSYKRHVVFVHDDEHDEDAHHRSGVSRSHYADMRRVLVVRCASAHVVLLAGRHTDSDKRYVVFLNDDEHDEDEHCWRGRATCCLDDRAIVDAPKQLSVEDARGSRPDTSSARRHIKVTRILKFVGFSKLK